MRQANQLQLKIKKLQEELETKEYTAGTGGDAVKVTVTGAYRLTQVQIQPEAASADDVEMLQDMILTAANEALNTAKKDHDEQMAKVTGGMSLPGLF
jgi:nucleoid-associated protein EbfC